MFILAVNHMKNKFQIFGSKSSTDYDIMVFVDKLPNTIDESHKMIKEFNSELAKIYTDKPVNANMCTLENGTVKDTFKGTSDEVNNSMYITFDIHPQTHSNAIKTKLERDIDLKLIRVFRIICAFLSRSKWRGEVKQALKGHLLHKIIILNQITQYLTADIYLGNKNVEHKDFFKILAFQLGQILGLFQLKELYTKEDIILEFPEFANAINRQPLNEADIEYLKHQIQYLINVTLKEFGHLNELNENTYESKYVNKKA